LVSVRILKGGLRHAREFICGVAIGFAAALLIAGTAAAQQGAGQGPSLEELKEQFAKLERKTVYLERRDLRLQLLIALAAWRPTRRRFRS
jgi:hypothetical protein